MGAYFDAGVARVLLHDEFKGGAPRDQRRELSITWFRLVTTPHGRVNRAFEGHFPGAGREHRIYQARMARLQQLQQAPHKKMRMANLRCATAWPMGGIAGLRRRIVLIHHQRRETALPQRQRSG